MTDNRSPRRAIALLTAVCLLAPLTTSRAEMIEEIVAWVNGEIISMSDLQTEEQMLLAEAYKRFTGEELDRYVEEMQHSLLLQMVDNKILISRAKMLYQIDRMKEALYEDFKAGQNVEDDEEFEAMLAREGMTVEGIKDRLVEMYAPDQVIGFEVGNRVSVSESELEAYYTEHADEFLVPGEVTIREIVLLADSSAKKQERRAEAEQILEEAVNDDNFAGLARRVSEAGTAQNGGLLGPLKKGDLSARLEEVAFGIPVGEVSALLDMPYGYHIVQVESREDDHIMELEEIRVELRIALENKKYHEAREEYLEKARTDAEWCVNPRYRDRLAVPSPICPTL